MYQTIRTDTRPPWQERQPSFFVKFAATLGLWLLAPIVFTMLLILLTVCSAVVGLLLAGRLPLGAAVVLAITAALWDFVWWLGRGRVPFRTTYPYRQSQARGLPYDVQFVPHMDWLPRQRFVGRGTLQFTPDELVIQGYRIGASTALFANIAIIVARVLVSIGIPQFTRQRTTITIPYAAPHQITVHGCTLKLRHTGTAPRTMILIRQCVRW